MVHHYLVTYILFSVLHTCKYTVRDESDLVFLLPYHSFVESIKLID